MEFMLAVVVLLTLVMAAVRWGANSTEGSTASNGIADRKGAASFNLVTILVASGFSFRCNKTRKRGLPPSVMVHLFVSLSNSVETMLLYTTSRGRILCHLKLKVAALASAWR